MMGLHNEDVHCHTRIVLLLLQLVVPSFQHCLFPKTEPGETYRLEKHDECQPQEALNNSAKQLNQFSGHANHARQLLRSLKSGSSTLPTLRRSGKTTEEDL